MRSGVEKGFVEENPGIDPHHIHSYYPQFLSSFLTKHSTLAICFHGGTISFKTREKGRGAIWESTGSYISLVLLGWGRCVLSVGGRQVKGGRGEHPHPQQAGPKIL